MAKATLKLAAAGVAEGRLRIDAEQGVVYGVSVLTVGPAQDHGFDVDGTMLDQCCAMINSAPLGLSVRASHPRPGEDPLLDLVGRLRTARVVGMKVLANLHLGLYAKHSPGGNLWNYILSLAEDDPAALGLSIVFDPAEFVRGPEGVPLGRIRKLIAVDLTAVPAANPAGLLSSIKGAATMDELLKAFLVLCGLSPDASDEEAEKFLAALTGQQKAIADKLATSVDAGAGTELARRAAGQSAPAASAGPGLLAERGRVRSLVSLGQKIGFSAEEVLEMAVHGTTMEEAQTLALQRLSATRGPLAIGLPEGMGMSDIRVGDDRSQVGLGQALGDAILLRAGTSLIARLGMVRPVSMPFLLRVYPLVYISYLLLQRCSTSGMNCGKNTLPIVSRKVLMMSKIPCTMG